LTVALFLAVGLMAGEVVAGLGSIAQRAVASLVLGRTAYQVNVMVGDLASRRRIAEALAVGRSFRLAS
jgi:hypothetical protein